MRTMRPLGSSIAIADIRFSGIADEGASASHDARSPVKTVSK
jgi:hypothetical protein